MMGAAYSKKKKKRKKNQDVAWEKNLIPASPADCCTGESLSQATAQHFATQGPSQKPHG